MKTKYARGGLLRRGQLCFQQVDDAGICLTKPCDDLVFARTESTNKFPIADFQTDVVAADVNRF